MLVGVILGVILGVISIMPSIAAIAAGESDGCHHH
jgi:F0F1-type ATP synthase assembly protein I